jgi:hypothetical protein
LRVADRHPTVRRRRKSPLINDFRQVVRRWEKVSFERSCGSVKIAPRLPARADDLLIRSFYIDDPPLAWSVPA